MRYTNDHKAETRARVLKEAAREIRAKGPDGVGVAGVMARAGLTHGGFYAHFPSKDALVVEAIGEMFDSARRRAAPLAASDDPRGALRAYVDFYLSAAHRDARERGCPLPALSGDFARAEAPMRERFGLGIASLNGRIATVLDAIGVAEPESEATALMAQLVGAVALARSVGAGAQSDAILARTRAAIVAHYGLEDAA
ncbi:TetR/AcrR family transcriptional regulator [Sphingomonas sp. AR_OL41]|uniref:TetR/AcrR family transcriptional regulator n=1 Tax=Sphingomonas sp. AR_OL41 TaxID=3042729 RepID=UPI0024815678|nr:TetR/AcrR family transcriptional regulator [Sphingomonas sp. AR_OL41]MDH7974263.1 TetR/AcrR family transcriptional regulator [Sphingomonas sp. AR_OL41]